MFCNVKFHNVQALVESHTFRKDLNNLTLKIVITLPCMIMVENGLRLDGPFANWWWSIGHDQYWFLVEMAWGKLPFQLGLALGRFSVGPDLSFAGIAISVAPVWKEEHLKSYEIKSLTNWTQIKWVFLLVYIVHIHMALAVNKDKEKTVDECNVRKQ